MGSSKTHIKDIQLKSKQTHEKVAGEIKIARSTYTSIINGHRMPSYGVACRIADYFKISLDDIKFGPIVTNSNNGDRKIS